MQLTNISSNYGSSVATGHGMLPSNGTFSTLTMVGSPFIIEQQLLNRTDDFIRAIRDKFLEANDQPKLNALKKIIRLSTHESNEILRQSLFKTEGYIQRLLSNESWAQWTEDRTALGKVIFAFRDCVNSFVSAEKCLERLDVTTLRDANEMASRVLKKIRTSNQDSKFIRSSTLKKVDCATGLVLGATGSLVSQNPIPIGLAGFNCLEGTTAEPTFQDHIILEPGEEWTMQDVDGIYLCKKKAPNEKGEGGCNYHGPNLHVTVIQQTAKQRYTPGAHQWKKVIHNGPLGGDKGWEFRYSGCDMFGCWDYYDPLTIKIKNKSRDQAAMYVYIK